MISEATSKSFSSAITRAIPEVALTVSSWAASRRFVSLERVADPSLAGYWKNERTPYLVEIMDAVNQSWVNEVVFVKSAQVGGTEAGNNIIGYFIDADPATILYVAENEGKARAWSTESFAPMLRDTPSLAELMGIAKSRDSNNQIESKAFPDGHFALAWATSAATLSSRPRRVVIKDESDAFLPTPEGDPALLAEARTKTAGSQRKIVDISTPRNAVGPDYKFSRIELAYQNSTAEKYFVPCPHCEEYQVLTWRDAEGVRNVQWETDQPETAYYICKECGGIIENEDKLWMLERGEWRSTNPDYTGNRRGFWICELYSPFTTWADMAAAYIDAENDPEKLRVFVNTRLAESWKPKDEKIEYVDHNLKTESYSAEVPEDVLVLTAGVDTQDDRLEVEVVGWGLDYESWNIDYKVFYGDPGKPEVWMDLKEYLLRDFETATGQLINIRAVCIDTGGHHPQSVYKFCKANAGRRWYAIKGANTPGKPIISPPSRNNSLRVKLFMIGTEAAKDLIFSHLKTVEMGPGYCHFPEARDENYFKMLCAEKKVMTFTSGRARHQWMKVSAHARNEAFDCRVYALAALTILNPDWKSYFKRHQEKQIEMTPPEEKNEKSIESQTEAVQTARSRPVRRSGFVSRGAGGFVGRWKK